ncbi:hypothetical protein C6H65_14895 [Photorhabdus luminescens]|nr:hypothetical protein C6H65_14895 [Photorhabdus luminescens]
MNSIDLEIPGEIPEVTVVKADRHCWIGGLRWSPYVKVKRGPRRRQRVRPVASRSQDTDVHLVVGNRSGRRQQTARMMGTGIIRKLYCRHTPYSLAIAFLSHSGPNGYGIYDLGEGQWLFLATQNGLPSVMADIVGTRESVNAALSRFLTFNPAPDKSWRVVSDPDNPAHWRSIISALSAHQYRMCRLQRRWRTPLLLMAVFIMLLIVVGVLLQSGKSPDERLPMTETVQVRASRLFEETPKPVDLPHPWADKPLLPAFLARCVMTSRTIPVLLAGWRLTAGSCRKDGVRLHYEIMPGGTAAHFVQRVQSVFKQSPVFDLVQGAKEGRVFLPWKPLPVRNEAVPAVSVQLMKMVSNFQQWQIPLTLNELTPASALPGDGQSIPSQDWREYLFSFSSRVMPAWLFAELDDTGLRLNSLTFTLTSQGQLTYQTEGYIYARK